MVPRSEKPRSATGRSGWLGYEECRCAWRPSAFVPCAMAHSRRLQLPPHRPPPRLRARAGRLRIADCLLGLYRTGLVQVPTAPGDARQRSTRLGAILLARKSPGFPIPTGAAQRRIHVAGHALHPCKGSRAVGPQTYAHVWSRNRASKTRRARFLRSKL